MRSPRASWLARREVFGYGFTTLEHCLNASVGQVSCDDQGPGEGNPRADRQLGQLGANLVHRTIQIDADNVVVEVTVGHLRQVLRRIGLKLLQEHPLRGDLGLGLTVR
jgi:hypothetical protein